MNSHQSCDCTICVRERINDYKSRGGSGDIGIVRENEQLKIQVGFLKCEIDKLHEELRLRAILAEERL